MLLSSSRTRRLTGCASAGPRVPGLPSTFPTPVFYRLYFQMFWLTRNTCACRGAQCFLTFCLEPTHAGSCSPAVCTVAAAATSSGTPRASISAVRASCSCSAALGAPLPAHPTRLQSTYGSAAVPDPALFLPQTFLMSSFPIRRSKDACGQLLLMLSVDMGAGPHDPAEMVTARAAASASWLPSGPEVRGLWEGDKARLVFGPWKAGLLAWGLRACVESLNLPLEVQRGSRKSELGCSVRLPRCTAGLQAAGGRWCG